MSSQRRFQVEILPVSEWTEHLRRFRHADAFGFDVGRDPATLRHSFLMFDANARESGGRQFYRASVVAFSDVAGWILDLGFDEIGVYYPIDAQRDVFERVAGEVMPPLRAAAPG